MKTAFLLLSIAVILSIVWPFMCLVACLAGLLWAGAQRDNK
jgi:hypothetical protein